MLSALIIGSGPAAAGAALALALRSEVQITVLDLGLRLEPDRQEALDHLSATEPAGWPADEVGMLSTQPIGSLVGGLPEKRSYGSDFPFRDVGQLREVTADRDVHRGLISPAYGGFSNVWGSQVMPFTAATFDTWPIAGREMEPHYRSVLERIPFAGEQDDLAGLFPLIHPPSPLPQLSERSRRVLAAYERHRAALNRLGLTVGKARLAFEASSCPRCGLCMTGCPYGLIYSAAQTFDRMRRSERITYHAGLLALEIAEENERVVVRAKEVATGRLRRFEADRLFVGCGALGTTRLVLGSLGIFDQERTLAESAQFTLPMLSRHAVRDPRKEAHFTLNQFNITNLTHPDHVLITTISMSDLTNGVAQADLHVYQSDVQGASLRPTTMHDSTSANDPMWLVREHPGAGGLGDGQHIDVVKMTNVLSITPTFTTTTLAVNLYSDVSTTPPLQPDGTVVTPEIDSRILKVAEQSNLLVATHSVSVSSTEADAQWYVINVSSGTPVLQDQGDVSGGEDTYIMYPAIDINPAGDIGMTYMQSGMDSDTDFLSMYVTGRKPADPAGTMQAPVVAQGGQQVYQDFGPLLGFSQRAGDLSGINEIGRAHV